MDVFGKCGKYDGRFDVDGAHTTTKSQLRM